MDDDVTLEEYNLKQREIFIRFLKGQETVRYRSRENGINEGIVVRDTITDLFDFAYCRKKEEYPEYAFLDMTGDGIEELLIRCNLDRLYVIQYDDSAIGCMATTVLKVVISVKESIMM